MRKVVTDLDIRGDLTVKGAPVSGGSPLPAGGTTGQILAKASATPGDAGWVSPAILGAQVEVGLVAPATPVYGTVWVKIAEVTP